MRFSSNRKHIVDLLFPIALFFVFAVSSLTVILLAANIYQSVTERTSLHDSARTSLSYISEKIHQSDAEGGVSLGTLEGEPALILRSHYGDDDFLTYIYAYEGSLMELFVREGTEANPAAGSVILPAADFTAEEISDGLFRFTCTDTNGQEASAVIGARSAART